MAMLEKAVAGGSTDPFARNALALEYIGAGRLDDGVLTFRDLRALDATYVPMYLMCGTALAKAGRVEEARVWLQDGVVAARSKGDSHALGVIEAALSGLGAG